jgi:hypothetical protein
MYNFHTYKKKKFKYYEDLRHFGHGCETNDIVMIIFFAWWVLCKAMVNCVYYYEKYISQIFYEYTQQENTICEVHNFHG